MNAASDERLGRRLLAGGLLLLGLGLAALRLVDARAENAWALVAPALVLAGYLALGISIMTRRD